MGCYTGYIYSTNAGAMQMFKIEQDLGKGLTWLKFLVSLLPIIIIDLILWFQNTV